MNIETDYDFSGWATRNNILCSDGRVIRKNAFADCDGKIVPLVWNHQHNAPDNVLGHALLKNKEDGVYTYGAFNDTDAGRHAKTLVEHGDINAISIFANHLTQNGSNVVHGTIREVSLVLAGANPGAFIDFVSVSHSDEDESEAIIYSGEDLSLEHSEDSTNTEKNDAGEHFEGSTNTEKNDTGEQKVTENSEEIKIASKKTTEEKQMSNIIEHADEKTIEEIFNTLTEEQKEAVYAIIGAIDEQEETKNERSDNMKHSVFDNENNEEVLSHADIEEIFADAKRYGSLKESVLQHGITNIGYLIPDSTPIDKEPRYKKRRDDWVSFVMDNIHRTPFAKVKSLVADVTAAEARAKGYVKGALKADEVISMLKRETTPTTIYKKQKIDRDDLIDITNFNVVNWLKQEMQMMLNEEIARAILVGDGRSSSSADKIPATNIRPIYSDDALYVTKVAVTPTVAAGATVTDEDIAKEFIRQNIKNRKNYRGSGDPAMFITEDVLSSCLLLEDVNGRVIYDSVDKLATALRVKRVISVPVLDGTTRADDTYTYDLIGIMVDLADYNIGADKGGEINMFDDFDIDYNAQKYLIETRCSGAMVQPFGALVFEHKYATPEE